MIELSLFFKELIFPVFCNKDLYWTAFYLKIDETVALFTAWHVLRDAQDITVLNIDHTNWMAFKIPIQRKHIVENCDIGFMESTLEVNLTEWFILNTSTPTIWSECWMAGFQGSSYLDWKASLKLYRYDWIIEAIHPVWTWVIKNLCYECSYHWEQWSSGGPVFNKENEIIGIHSGGFKWIEWASFMTPFYEFIRKDKRK